MTLQWVSSDLRTGRVLADLPDLVANWPLRRSLGQYETAQANLLLRDSTNPSWPRATQPGAAVLHVYDDEDDTRALLWSGWVTKQRTIAQDDIVELSLATIEAYFDRRYVGDITYTNQGQNLILRDLATRFAIEGTVPGLPMTLQTVTAGTGLQRTKTYKDSENATLFERLTELTALVGGPEWTIEWAWSADGKFILPTLFVGDRIGVSPPAGRAPAATFEMPGSLITFDRTTDYSSGKGATSVLAYSSGQGDDTPTAVASVAPDFGGRPTFETRYAPTLSVIDSSTLASFAARAAQQLAPGQVAVTMTALISNRAPRYGLNFRMGDDIGWSIQSRLSFPDGFAGVGRMIAYELNLATFSPIVAVPNPLEDDS